MAQSLRDIMEGRSSPPPGPAAPAEPSEQPADRRSLRDILTGTGEPTPIEPLRPLAPGPRQRPLPTSLGEELAEFPRLYKQASTENFKSMVGHAKKAWEHDTLFGHVWNSLATVGDLGMYVMSPVQAAIEYAAEPLETFGGAMAQEAIGAKKNPLRGLAHSLGESGSIAAQFAADPLVGLGYASGAGRLLRAVREGPVGTGLEKTFSASTRTERVPRQMTDPLGAPVFDAAGKPVYHRGRKIDPATGLGEILYERVPQAAELERAKVKWWGIKNLESARRRHEMEQFQAVMGAASHDDRMNFNYFMDGDPAAAPLPTGLQPVADTLRKMLDAGEKRLVKIGALARASEDYWPRLFKDPQKAEDDYTAWRAAQAAANPRRPMQGSKRAAGLLKRTVPTLRESIDRGMELVTDNPIEMALLRLDGMDRHYYGTLLGREIKALPYVRFFAHNMEHAAHDQGLVKLDDKFMEARLAPASVDKTFKAEAIHSATFDPSLRKGIEDVARYLGVETLRPVRHEDVYLTNHPTVLGYAQEPRHTLEPGMTPGTRAISQFGNQEATMLHEIGHHIEFQYKLADAMINGDPKAWEELKQLALLRSADPATLLARDPNYYAYVIDPDERIANFFHAYWHAPGLLKSIAPNADRFVRNWLKDPSRATLQGLVDSVRPSVRSVPETRTQRFEEVFKKTFPGIRYLGSWYAPESVATTFNNFVSPGVKAQRASDLLRFAGNTLNMAQLSLSAFHLVMVSLDSAVSAVSQVPRALRRGEFGKAAELGAAALPIVGPVYSGWRQTLRGNKFLKELMNPQGSTPDWQQMIKAFEVSGGRVGMDMIYRSNGMGGFLQAIKGGYLDASVRDTLKSVSVKTPVARQVMQGWKLAMRTLETTVEPIMTEFVPRVKLGVFQDMASEWLKAHPGHTTEEFLTGMQSIWNNVDNRLGEMVYDNLSWNKVLKDLSFLAVRAVGWNLGTVRELGGGLVDAVKQGQHALTGTPIPELSERTRYSIALPFVVGLQGAVVNWMLTGKPPKEMLDYFYPRTGKTTKDGSPERLSIPSYVKDIFAYNYDPYQTVMNKLHPMWEIFHELVENRDYYGGAIRDPLDPTWAPVQYAKYGLRQFIPFGVRGIVRQMNEGADFLPILMSEFGFVPAPVSITNPRKLERYQLKQDVLGHRRAVKERLLGQ